jgi:hypothetical protein
LTCFVSFTEYVICFIGTCCNTIKRQIPRMIRTNIRIMAGTTSKLVLFLIMMPVLAP